MHSQSWRSLLRARVSQSESLSHVSQYKTLERPLEAVYGPYSNHINMKENTVKDEPCTTPSVITAPVVEEDES